MVNIPLPRFSYPITRDVQWRMEPFVYLVALLAIGILIPLNYALTGYQTVTMSNSNYNYVPDHWYNSFTRRPKPGSHCDKYMLNVGDTLVTSTGILTYQLAAVLVSGNGTSPSSLPYTGTTLAGCDVSYMSATADARLRTSTIVAGVACTNGTAYPVIFSTSFNSASYYDGSSSTFGVKANYQVGGLSAVNSLSYIVSYILDDAGRDLFDHVGSIYTSMPNNAGPAIISVSAAITPGSDYPPWWCSVVASTANPSCMTDVPDISVNTTDLTLLDLNGEPVTIIGLESNYTGAITNAMQAMLAAVRLDLGNIFPNNILVNPTPDLINNTIEQKFIVDNATDADGSASILYQDLAGPDSTGLTLSDEEKEPSTIAVEYQCRTEQLKSPGSLLVAVAVATLTFFKAGWAVFLLALTFWARRAQPEGPFQP
ncbi:hypothetical protein FRB98_000222 [Tulasnella sp. 332]|nr:hypothetical protein FRB98_000222 [Tulasnella sp. 332]